MAMERAMPEPKSKNREAKLRKHTRVVDVIEKALKLIWGRVGHVVGKSSDEWSNRIILDVQEYSADTVDPRKNDLTT